MELRTAILKSNHSVQEIAELMGVSRQTVYGWMNGSRPEENKMERLREILNITDCKGCGPKEMAVIKCMEVMSDKQKMKIVSLAAGMTGTDISEVTK